MKTKMEKCCIRFMLVAVLLFLSACGREERQRGIDGCIYEAELVPDTEDWGSNFKKNGKWLYYIGYGPALYRTSLEEDGTPGGGKAETVKGGDGILDYTLDEEGNLYCYKVAVVWEKTGKVRMNGGTLTRYGGDGGKEYQVSLDGREAEYEALSPVPGFLAAGSEEHVFLLKGDVILVIDGAGKAVSEIDISSNRPERWGFERERLLEGGDGRVYYLVTDRTRHIMYEIVGDDTSWRLQGMSGSEWEGKWPTSGIFSGSPYGMLYSGLDGNLEEYSPQEGKWRAVLNWSESSLWQSPQEVVRLREDKILASYFRISNTGETREEFYLLNQRRIEELPEREELVLACLSCPKDLENAVVSFNRSNSQYHVTIRIYEGEDAGMRLDTALVSADPPDMLELTELDVAKYGGKQALEDLSPWLESSGSLVREDFLEEILEGYTINGRLVGIPSSFLCGTLLGNLSEVGSEPGWKVEDVIRLTERYPGRKLNGRSFYYNLDRILGDYIMEHFIDRENGECSFDSEEFCSLMVWLAEHSGNGTDYYAVEAVEDPLIVEETIVNISDYIAYILRSEKGISMVGYPSMDGEPLYRPWGYGAVGMTEKSRHKEGAWQFIEYFLSEGVEQAYHFMIPSRRDLLEEILENAMEPVYETINGKTVLDEEGNPVEKPKWRMQRVGEEQMEYSHATREEVDSFLDMIAHADFTPADSLKTEAVGIIAEEAESCFGGNKSVEEAAEIIQNRVSILVKELM